MPFDLDFGINTTWEKVALFLALGHYVVAFLVYYRAFLFQKPKKASFAFLITLGAIFWHALFLLLNFIHQPYPYIKSTFQGFQLLSFGVGFGFLILCLWKRFFRAGIVFVPLILLFFAFSLFLGNLNFDLPKAILDEAWALFHLSSIFLAVIIFLISLVIGFLYLYLVSKIKAKKLNPFLLADLSLKELEKAHFLFLYAGFVVFTVAIVAGAGWSKAVFGYYVQNELKQFFSFFLWGFFAIFLNFGPLRGWVGKKGVLFSSFGLIGILLLLMWSSF